MSMAQDDSAPSVEQKHGVLYDSLWWFLSRRNAVLLRGDPYWKGLGGINLARTHFISIPFPCNFGAFPISGFSPLAKRPPSGSTAGPSGSTAGPSGSTAGVLAVVPLQRAVIPLAGSSTAPGQR